MGLALSGEIEEGNDKTAPFSVDGVNGGVYINHTVYGGKSMSVSEITKKYMSKGVGGRVSIGLTRADNLLREARRLEALAKAAGNDEAARLADEADCCAGNSRAGYEAAQIIGRGGSSEAWALRSRGAMWLSKGRKKLEKARALMGIEETPLSALQPGGER